MQLVKSIRRTLASLLLTAGLVYPACAEICPKGTGSCHHSLAGQGRRAVCLKGNCYEPLLPYQEVVTT